MFCDESYPIIWFVFCPYAFSPKNYRNLGCVCVICMRSVFIHTQNQDKLILHYLAFSDKWLRFLPILISRVLYFSDNVHIWRNNSLLTWLHKISALVLLKNVILYQVYLWFRYEVMLKVLKITVACFHSWSTYLLIHHSL